VRLSLLGCFARVVVERAPKAFELGGFFAHEASDSGAFAGTLLDLSGAGVVAGAVAAQQEQFVQSQHVVHRFLAWLLIEPADGLVGGVGVQHAVVARACGEIEQLLVNCQDHELGAAGGMKDDVFAVQFFAGQLQSSGLHGLRGAVVKRHDAHQRLR